MRKKVTLSIDANVYDKAEDDIAENITINTTITNAVIALNKILNLCDDVFVINAS